MAERDFASVEPHMEVRRNGRTGLAPLRPRRAVPGAQSPGAQSPATIPADQCCVVSAGAGTGSGAGAGVLTGGSDSPFCR